MLAVLPDAAVPEARSVKGPETVWPSEGDVKDAVGTLFVTVKALVTVALAAPVESTTYIANV